MLTQVGGAGDRVRQAVGDAVEGLRTIGGAKLAAQNKLFVRDRIDALCDPGTFTIFSCA